MRDAHAHNLRLRSLNVAGRHKRQLLARALSLDSEHGGDAWTSSEAPAPRLLDILPARDARADPELQLLVVEQLSSIIRALPTLTPSERQALARTLAGETYAALAREFGTAKAASQAAFRARRKLAAALPRAA